jgi:hypothetical protein
VKIPPDALIAPEKLTKYLLIRRIKDDKSRYLAQAGFDLSNPQLLAAAIRHASQQTEATIHRANQHGIYYNQRCELTGPGGHQLPVLLVWLLRLDGIYSFITLLPDKERRP